MIRKDVDFKDGQYVIFGVGGAKFNGKELYVSMCDWHHDGKSDTLTIQTDFENGLTVGECGSIQIVSVCRDTEGSDIKIYKECKKAMVKSVCTHTDGHMRNHITVEFELQDGVDTYTMVNTVEEDLIIQVNELKEEVKKLSMDLHRFKEGIFSVFKS